ncbi:MAG: hypothetical protein KDA52_08735 [Planctomycetaceae bacterium]|nr:hypothetical protein [Planctomycetaceae bacterium]
MVDPADDFALQREVPERKLGDGMRQTMTANHTAPVENPVYAELLRFPENFDTHNPLDEILREEVRRTLQVGSDKEVCKFMVAGADRQEEQARRR